MSKLLVLLLSAAFVALGGVTNRNLLSGPQGRIVGGVNTTIEEYPYNVVVTFRGLHFCGGTIISNRWVITAAQCVYDIEDPFHIIIRVGSTYSIGAGQLNSAQRIIVHPLFDPAGYEYDIALLHLHRETSHFYAQPVPLPPAGFIPSAGNTVVVTGYGAGEEQGNSTIILQKVELPVIDQAICRSIYSTVFTEKMLCAGFLETGGQDACRGDSGSPAVTEGVLVGIVAFGRGCARPGYPGVYTNIGSYVDWILENADI